MPKLWSQTITSHRHVVRDATIDAVAKLMARHGLRGVTMSQVAETVGIGRATLYKYFPDVESILSAWHERQVGAHVEQLMSIKSRSGSAHDKLEAVLLAYAQIQHQLADMHATELAVHLHRGEHVTKAQQRLHRFFQELLSEGVMAGEVRNDITPDELASYCLHALAAASNSPSDSAVQRLVDVTMSGLAPHSE